MVSVLIGPAALVVFLATNGEPMLQSNSMESLDGWKNAARDADKKEDFREALRCIESALKLAPEDAGLWFWHGRLNHDLKTDDIAIQSYHNALRYDPSLHGAYSGLGSSFVDLARWAEAEESYLKAVESGPRAWTYVLLGYTQWCLDKNDLAEASFRKALTIDPNDDEAMLNLAMMIRSERPDEAVRLLRRAIEIDPGSAVNLSELGHTLARLGRNEEAEPLLRRSLELRPNQYWTHINLGIVLSSCGNHAGAELEYLRAAEIFPQGAFPHCLLAEVYEKQGRVDEAEISYTRGVEVDSEDAVATFRLARFLAQQGRHNEAKLWLARTRTLDPQHPKIAAVEALIAQKNRDL